MLNKFSGLYGISGVSHDVREIIDRMEKGDENCKLAIDMYVYRMVKYIGYQRNGKSVVINRK
ncbi:hypothetical protein [Paucisalibacillus sp. EB02]|uniref:hypothetical protein n=1 Tax=Paucisalibacillus sp. EB02 TaxID=1347087 RepID=UPI0004B48791|nr:hypothetical protein [Paucisalibacillus sp. EB02]